MASNQEDEEGVGMEDTEDLNRTLSDLVKENEVTSEKDILIEAIEAKLRKIQDLYKESLDEQHNIRTKYNATVQNLAMRELIDNKLYEEHEWLQKIPKDRETFLKVRNELKLRAMEWKEKYYQLAINVDQRKPNNEQRKLDDISKMFITLTTQFYEETEQMTMLLDAIDAQIPKDVKTPFVTINLDPRQVPPNLKMYLSQQIAKEDLSNDDFTNDESDEEAIVTFTVDVAKFNKIKKDLDNDRIELANIYSSIERITEQPSAEKGVPKIAEEEIESDDRIELAKMSSSIETVNEQPPVKKEILKIPEVENKGEPLYREPTPDANFHLRKDSSLESIESDDAIELAKVSSSIERVTEQLSAEKRVFKVPGEENKEKPRCCKPTVDAGFRLPKDSSLEAVGLDDRIELAKMSSSIEGITQQLSAEKGLLEIPAEENKEKPLCCEPTVDTGLRPLKDKSLEMVEVKQQNEKKTKPKTDINDIETQPLRNIETKDEHIAEMTPQEQPKKPPKKVPSKKMAKVAHVDPLEDLQRISSLDVSKKSTFYGEEQTPGKVVTARTGGNDSILPRLSTDALRANDDKTSKELYPKDESQKELMSKKHTLENSLQDSAPQLTMLQKKPPLEKLGSVSTPQKAKIADKPPDRANSALKSTKTDFTPKKATPPIQQVDKLSNQRDSKQPTKASPKPGNKLAASPKGNKKGSPVKPNMKVSPAKSNMKASPDKSCKGNTACCSKKARDGPPTTCNTCKNKSPKTDRKAAAVTTKNGNKPI